MNDFKINGYWVINNPHLTNKEKEILYLTAEAAGITVNERTRTFMDDEQFPLVICLASKAPAQICSGVLGIMDTGNAYSNNGWQEVSYEQVINKLREMVKDQSIYKCF